MTDFSSMPRDFSSEAARVLLTGACGAVGPTLVQRFLQAGHRVRIYDRLPLPAVLSNPDIEYVRGDIADRALLREAMLGVRRIVHMAAKLHINNPDPSLRSEYFRINVEGTRAVAEAALSAGAERLVLFSTICVYGPSRPPEVFDENSPLNPDSWYAETKCEAEQIVLNTLPAAVLRPAAVYGPRITGNYLRLLRTLQRGWFAYVGSGGNRRTLVYDEDLAAAALLAAQDLRATGRIYNVTDGSIPTFRNIVEAMCAALGRKPPRLAVPIGMIKILAAAAEFALQPFRLRSPVTRAMVMKLVEDTAVSDARIENELQYRPEINLREGWKRVVSSPMFPQ